MVHDRGDALFDALDVNGDGQLGEREIAAVPARLREQDADGDGSLAEPEAPYQMTGAFLRNEPPNAPPFSIIPPAFAAASQERGLPAWFAAADLNDDGDLSRREFLGTSQHFARLDANRDGFVDRGEAEPAAAGSPPPVGQPAAPGD